jgi:hypothetical protein
MQPCTKISHIQALVINFFPTPPIKLKLRLKVCGRLLIATHLDQSNYLANEKQGAVNSYDLIVFKRLLQGSSRAVKAVGFCSASSGWTDESHLRFPLQGHIPGIGGGVLRFVSRSFNSHSYVDLTPQVWIFLDLTKLSLVTPYGWTGWWLNT